VENAVVGVERRRTFEAVVRDHGTGLTQLAFFLCRNQASAEELVAEALARTWVRWRDGEVEDLVPYLRRVVANLAHKMRYRRLLSLRYETHFDAMLQGDRVSETVATRVDLVRAVLRLPLPQREVIVLRYFEDMSEMQVAKTLSISTGTVKSRTSRALATLNRVYGGDFDA
jgi:RNA polymerase sigma-70 factor, ECF subfamily